MPYTVSTLLLRNLHDVFGEIDPVRRRAAIDEIFRQDAVFHEPNGIYRGRDEIDRIASMIKASHPDFQYQLITPPEELGDAGRVRWVSGSPGKPPAYAGLRRNRFHYRPGRRDYRRLSLFRWPSRCWGAERPFGLIVTLRPAQPRSSMPRSEFAAPT
jgi:hypothetical protein